LSCDARVAHDARMDEGAMADLELTYDPARLPMDDIVDCLRTTYWAENRPESAIRTSWAGSNAVAALLTPEGELVAFARAVTDGAVVAYLADVFVTPESRGLGLGKRIVASLVDRDDLRGLGWLLHTRDAHGLYRQFGFERPYARLMERQPGVAKVPGATPSPS
jgi:GNAT superfamily N-acetyltransferase